MAVRCDRRCVRVGLPLAKAGQTTHAFETVQQKQRNVKPSKVPPAAVRSTSEQTQGCVAWGSPTATSKVRPNKLQVQAQWRSVSPPLPKASVPGRTSPRFGRCNHETGSSVGAHPHQFPRGDEIETQLMNDFNVLKVPGKSSSRRCDQEIGSSALADVKEFLKGDEIENQSTNDLNLLKVAHQVIECSPSPLDQVKQVKQPEGAKHVAFARLSDTLETRHRCSIGLEYEAMDSLTAMRLMTAAAQPLEGSRIARIIQGMGMEPYGKAKSVSKKVAPPSPRSLQENVGRQDTNFVDAARTLIGSTNQALGSVATSDAIPHGGNNPIAIGIEYEAMDAMTAQHMLFPRLAGNCTVGGRRSSFEWSSTADSVKEPCEQFTANSQASSVRGDGNDGERITKRCPP